MEVQRFDPAADSAAVRACYEIYRSGAPVDDPVAPPMPFRCFAGWLEFGWSMDPVEVWLALTAKVSGAAGIRSSCRSGRTGISPA